MKLYCPNCGRRFPRAGWSLIMHELHVVHNAAVAGTLRIYRHRLCGKSAGFIVRARVGVTA